jgi:hypothetical protein
LSFLKKLRKVFIQTLQLKSRIIITPEHAKRLLTALEDNIEKYEAANGRIKIQQEPPGFPMNFGGTMGQA